MYNQNDIWEMVDEEHLTDAEELLDFIVDHDMGDVYVEWINSNK
jgi:hypothetical protein